jgi:hypothetical protein
MTLNRETEGWTELARKMRGWGVGVVRGEPLKGQHYQQMKE